MPFPRPRPLLPATAMLTGLILLGLPPRARSQAPPAPAVADRAAEFQVAIERNVMIPVRDGVRLAADIYRPAREGRPAPGRFPSLFTRTPYDKRGTGAEGTYYAERGYVVVANDTRGRYASEGAWNGLANDPEDGYDVVEWIAARPWSDSKVGTFGTSYPGGTQHAMAEMSPPHLTTMIPIDALSNCGVAGMRHGGAFELRFVNWIFQTGAPASKAAMADPALRRALEESGRRIRQHVGLLPVRPGTTPLRLVPEYEAWLVAALRSGPESPFWHVKGMSVVDHVKDYADIPVLHVTGWYDSWTRQVTMNYQALAPAKSSVHRLVIGPWTHGAQGSNLAGEVEFTPEAAVDLLRFRLRWYDRWLKGVRNGVDDDPPVLLYVMGTGDDRRSAGGRLRHGGSWRAEREWPIARTRPTAFYLHADGSLAPEPPREASSRTTYTFDPRRPVPTIGGNISSSQGLMSAGGYDQRARPDGHPATDELPLSERRDVLVFRSAPLAEDVEVTGTVEAKLWISSTAPDTDFTAKLIDEVPPNADYPLGFDLNLGDSILRARYREGLDHQAPALKAGEAVPITITLYPTSNVFKKGHRIRVDVSSSNYPRFDVNPNTGEPLGEDRRTAPADNTVFHDAAHPSSLVLPIIPPPR
ncbi:Cocaine esterase [Aquisphaera giovannonii]|uniref:Cocaine esterase n=1 Tax=Aquisphaera giovannonii TaxID=406548 RepID=A0A5B9WC68_9BACT|nr:CocE/NonD family hydrolase [Aquisphaera giovannonii]QEH37541.1 Cocaine esterase [Aquisphaera giovannonii]